MTQGISHIPVIDIFAGPGGLGEGFSAWSSRQATSFEVRLSIEKEPFAHETLELRMFFREFGLSGFRVPDDYYSFLRKEISRNELFTRYERQANAARRKAWLAELGTKTCQRSEVNQRISAALNEERMFVLIGGPPCQAYSIVGRSRRSKIDIEKYNPEKDVRQRLYVEYLQILADHQPVVFVMENVKGLLSAKLKDEEVFKKMLNDLREPAIALQREGRQVTSHSAFGYRLFSLVEKGECFPDADVKNFLVQTEEYGIPQARHRVIILGIRNDLPAVVPKRLKEKKIRNLCHALKGLPRLRSGLSKGESSDERWFVTLKETLNAVGDGRKLTETQRNVKKILFQKLTKLHTPQCGFGGEFVNYTGTRGNGRTPTWADKQFGDLRIGGTCNHEARKHMPEDLHRYFYAACHTILTGISPTLAEFPLPLLPQHRNVQDLMGTSGESRQLNRSEIKFPDRFRVQPFNRPCTTVTSHIAKDGHYYIHPDATQCRSFTVREAARIQTFPDNYVFCGPRTAQYQQVGNAVPPLLARQIAGIVHDVLIQVGLVSTRRKK